MSKIIAKYLFNPYFVQFVTSYIESYGDIPTNARDIVLKELKTDINNNDNISDEFSTASFRLWTSSIKPVLLNETILLPELVQIVSSYFILPVDMYQELFLRSFEDPVLLNLLKESDINSLLNEKNYHKCLILQDLQLKEVCNYPEEAMSHENLTTFVKWLNGAYCIVQFVKVIPPEFLLELDTQKVLNSSSWRQPVSSLWCILQNLFTNFTLLRLWDSVNELCWSSYTPLYQLIPETYHDLLSNYLTLTKYHPALIVSFIEGLPAVLLDLKTSKVWEQDVMDFLDLFSEMVKSSSQLLITLVNQREKLRRYLQTNPDSVFNLQAFENFDSI